MEVRDQHKLVVRLRGVQRFHQLRQQTGVCALLRAYGVGREMRGAPILTNCAAEAGIHPAVPSAHKESQPAAMAKTSGTHRSLF